MRIIGIAHELTSGRTKTDATNGAKSDGIVDGSLDDLVSTIDQIENVAKKGSDGAKKELMVS